MIRKSHIFRKLTWMALLLATACVSSDKISIDSMNFDQQIDVYQNLEFTFDRDLVSDSLTQHWDSVRYLEIKPEINGRYQWSGRRTLVFSPSVPFAPNTDYTIRLRDEIARHLPDKKAPVTEEISFHTPYLAVERSQTYWGIDETNHNNVQLRILATFNYPVETSVASRFISVKMDGQPVHAEMLTTGSNKEIMFSIAAPANGSEGRQLTLTIAKGMTCIGSQRQTTRDETIDLVLPERDRLDISDVEANFEEGEGVITVYTSQPVVEQGLKAMVRTSPEVAFETSVIGNGFKLRGDFADGQTYELNVSGTLKGVFGPELGEDFRQTVTFGDLQPYIAFTDQSGMYLTPQGSSNLGINIINVPKVKVTVFRVFENNIQHYLRMGKQWDWNYEDDEYHDTYAYRLDDDYGQVISTRTIDTRSLPGKGSFRLLRLQPGELQLDAASKGIYLVKVESTEKKWLSDVQLVSVSDIGLIVKEGTDEIFVVTRSIATAKPLSGVNIRFISKNNQQQYQATTNSEGIAVFKNTSATSPGSGISMITARKAEDFNVLLFNRSQVETSGFEVGGKRTAGLNYDVFLYGDRNLYRPGDSVFVNAIVRDFRWETIAGLPVRFRVISPDGKDFIVRRAMLSKTGSAQLMFRVPESSLTGGYIVELLSSNDVLMGSYRIGVEEFMPDRIRVGVKTSKDSYGLGEELSAEITATNLFGPPASGRKTETELRVSRKAFTAKGYEDYSFSIIAPLEIYFENIVNEGLTDASGKDRQTFALPQHTDIGLLSGKLFTTVFDETGRPVNRYNEVEIQTQSTFLGIGPTSGWVSTGKPLSIQMAALNRAGKPVTAKAHLEIVSIRWETVLERNYGSTSYNSQRKEKTVLSRNVTIGNNGLITQFSPPVSGEYEIRLRNEGTTNYVVQSFYAYGWADAGPSSFQVNRAGEIDVETDKKLYAPGETARLLFKTPFPGELILTIEQNRVLEHYSIEANTKGAQFDLKIRDEFMPNVYITATLIRKTDNSGLPLTVAHGFSSLKVEKPDRKLSISIEAPEKQRSGRNQQIKVKTSPGAEVTIAAVDEGILQITGFVTPDPYAYFYQKRALEVNAYDLFDELFPELASGRSSTGGDRGFDIGKRLNPLTSKRVKLLSLWSGVRKADANGLVSFNIAIPKFSGAVRIMAVAQQGNRFGSSEKTMKIADPLVISSSLPRFLSPGDEARVAVTITNTTAASRTVKINTVAKGPASCGDLSAGSIEIPANSERIISYTLSAAGKIGQATVTLTATSSGESFTEEISVPVRPAATLQKTAEAGMIRAGENKVLKADDDFLPGTAASKLLITRSPAGQYARDLNELVNYPYGCLEQTVSVVFPQLYFGDLLKMMNQKEKYALYSPAENIREAILKIEGLQQYNGGLVTWPGNHATINWWATAYAGNFLYEASRAGYEVNQKVTDNIMQYLTGMVRQKGYTEYFYLNKAGIWEKKNQPQREIFYSLYVLALAGKQHLPTMNYFKARANELSIDSRYMLACAYALTGDNRSFESILPRSWDNSATPAVMSGGSYSSPVRDRAIALYTLVSADPDNPQIAVLAKQVGEMIRQNHWLSTQERAFAMLSLGKLAGISTTDKITATVEVNGRKTAAFEGKDLLLNLTGTSAAIRTSGQGRLFYYLESEGIPSSGKVKEEDQVLKVRRTYYNRNGGIISPESIRQNDLIVIGISILTTDNSTVENVAITDLLPAGFEIENPRLNAERELSWIINKATPDYQDIRDDRITFFTNVSGKSQTFYYMVRAVSQGTFIAGPVGADAMYNGQYRSYSGSGKVVIR